MSKSLILSARPNARVRVLILVAAVLGLLSGGVSTQGPRFYSDDPIAREPESQDASKVSAYQRPTCTKCSITCSSRHVTSRSGLRAKNINTIDEVPDSSWFTNRIGTTTVTTEQITRGAIVGPPPDPSSWVVIREKTSGVHPGFTARDAKGDTFFLEFDPPYFAEGATGAVAVATKIFWALGYNQVESYLTTFDPKRARLIRRPRCAGPPAPGPPSRRTISMRSSSEWRRIPMERTGSIAGRLLPGKILGGFRYDGTRPDDPNDIVPHEHRRELRALRVFGAWTNLTDLKAANTLDTLLTENGRTRVKHYLQDVGSTFGMCNEIYEWDLSYEHFYQGDTTRKRLFSFGFALSPWQTVATTRYPSIGKFEGDVFDPVKWRPQTPTTAYMETRDDDAFWAARRVGAFTDELIRAAARPVSSATRRLRNPGRRADQTPREDQEHLSDCSEPDREPASRRKPLDVRERGGRGRRRQRLGHVPGIVDELQQRDRRHHAAVGDTESDHDHRSAAGLPTASGSFVAVDIAADIEAYPTWKQPVRAYFRRDGGSWKLVGLERQPEKVENPRAGEKASR